jgi:peptidoglycan/xylan/chitin deacetylase (PgdA/CDA1 family)
VLELFDKHRIRPTAVVNVDALKLYPDITRAIRERGWDVLGHGMSNTRFLYDYSEERERAYYREMLDTVEDLTCVRMKGMGGPGPQAGTENTPDLMAEAGFVYSGDWYMDDQPFPLRVRRGKLIAMPYSVEMNDVSALATAEADEFLENLKRQFDKLYAEGEESGRVMCFSLHPPLIGQPQRIRYLEQALEYFNSFPHVWHAHGAEIASYYLDHYYDEAVRRAAILREARG